MSAEGDAVIPTLILLGVIFGRWWRSALVVSTLGWTILLVADDVMDVEPALVWAALLAALNTGVGVLIHQCALWTYRRVRGRARRLNDDEPR